MNALRISTTVFTEARFWSLVVFSVVLPCAIYAALLAKRSISRTTVLLFGLALVAMAGGDVYLLQSLASAARQTPSLSGNALFVSGAGSGEGRGGEEGRSRGAPDPLKKKKPPPPPAAPPVRERVSRRATLYGASVSLLLHCDQMVVDNGLCLPLKVRCGGLLPCMAPLG